jgi:hypothetical protein
VKDNFCEESECVFDKFPKYHRKMLLGDFIAKVGRDDIFRQLGMKVYKELIMIMEFE